MLNYLSFLIIRNNKTNKATINANIMTAETISIIFEELIMWQRYNNRNIKVKFFLIFFGRCLRPALFVFIAIVLRYATNPLTTIAIALPHDKRDSVFW